MAVGRMCNRAAMQCALDADFEKSLHVAGELSGANADFSGALSGASLSLTTPLALASGGVGAADADEARENLVTVKRPKLLWSGSWSSGSITVDGFSSYKLFLLQTADGDAALCWVDFGLLLGGELYPLTGDGGQMIYSIRAGVNGNTLSMQNSYAILRPLSNINGGKYERTVKTIYGLLLNDDVLAEGE